MRDYLLALLLGSVVTVEGASAVTPEIPNFSAFRAACIDTDALPNAISKVADLGGWSTVTKAALPNPSNGVINFDDYTVKMTTTNGNIGFLIFGLATLAQPNGQPRKPGHVCRMSSSSSGQIIMDQARAWLGGAPIMSNTASGSSIYFLDAGKTQGHQVISTMNDVNAADQERNLKIINTQLQPNGDAVELTYISFK